MFDDQKILVFRYIPWIREHPLQAAIIYTAVPAVLLTAFIGTSFPVFVLLAAISVGILSFLPVRVALGAWPAFFAGFFYAFGGGAFIGGWDILLGAAAGAMGGALSLYATQAWPENVKPMSLFQIFQYTSDYIKNREKAFMFSSRKMWIPRLSPGHRYESNKVIRGRYTELIWAIQLVLTFKAMLSPGFIEILMPYVGEYAFMTLMIMMVYLKFRPVAVRLGSLLSNPLRHYGISKFLDSYKTEYGEARKTMSWRRAVGHMMNDEFPETTRLAWDVLIALASAGVVYYIGLGSIGLPFLDNGWTAALTGFAAGFLLVPEALLGIAEFMVSVIIFPSKIIYKSPLVVLQFVKALKIAFYNIFLPDRTPPRLVWVAATVGDTNKPYIVHMWHHRWSMAIGLSLALTNLFPHFAGFGTIFWIAGFFAVILGPLEIINRWGPFKDTKYGTQTTWLLMVLLGPWFTYRMTKGYYASESEKLRSMVPRTENERILKERKEKKILGIMDWNSRLWLPYTVFTVLAGAGAFVLPPLWFLPRSLSDLL